MRRNTNGSICLLQESYYNKKEFVKDFIQLCRSAKKSHIESGTVGASFLHQFVGVCGEYWSFCIYVSAESIATDAAVVVNSKWLKYPKTTWGSPYSRWDTELREFLNREVCRDNADT